jgi:hypothetical protein
MLRRRARIRLVWDPKRKAPPKRGRRIARRYGHHHPNLNDPVLPSLRSPFRGIDSHCGICATICAASTEKEEDPAAKLRRWRAWVLRQRAQPLGTVEAPDERAAEAAAAGPASRESGE